MINRFRRLLIQIGKVMPFILCFVVFIGYVETLVWVIVGHSVVYGNNVVICSYFSIAIGSVFEYNYMTVIAMFILSVAIETCYWNKLACLYLLIHIAFKIYIQDVELDESMVVILSTINVVVSGFLVYKGVKMVK